MFAPVVRLSAKGLAPCVAGGDDRRPAPTSRAGDMSRNGGRPHEMNQPNDTTKTEPTKNEPTNNEPTANEPTATEPTTNEITN